MATNHSFNITAGRFNPECLKCPICLSQELTDNRGLVELDCCNTYTCINCFIIMIKKNTETCPCCRQEFTFLKDEIEDKPSTYRSTNTSHQVIINQDRFRSQYTPSFDSEDRRRLPPGFRESRESRLSFSEQVAKELRAKAKNERSEQRKRVIAQMTEAQLKAHKEKLRLKAEAEAEHKRLRSERRLKNDELVRLKRLREANGIS